MPAVVKATGLDFVSANRQDGSVLARRGVSAFSWGEDVAVFIKKIDDKTTSVEVVSKKMVTGNLAARDWVKPIFRELDVRFKRIH